MWVTVTSRYISQHTHVVLGSCDRAEALQMASLGGLSSSLTLQDPGNEVEGKPGLDGNQSLLSPPSLGQTL